MATGKQAPLKVNSNGALRRAAGVGKNGKVKMANVRKLAKGTGITAERARFYADVLHHPEPGK